MARYSKKKVIKKKSVNKNKNKNTRVKKRRVSRGKSRRRVKRKYVGGGVDDKVTTVDGKQTKVKLNTYPRTVLLAMFIFALLRLERSKLETLFSKKSEKSEKINNFINALINLKTSLPRGGGGSNGPPQISEPIVDPKLLTQLQNEYNLRPRVPPTDPQTARLLARFNIPVSEESVTHTWEEIPEVELLTYSTRELKNKQTSELSELNVKIAIDLAVAASKIEEVASLTPTYIKKLFGDIEVEETDL